MSNLGLEHQVEPHCGRAHRGVISKTPVLSPALMPALPRTRRFATAGSVQQSDRRYGLLTRLRETGTST